jgi:mono/diheme cytochrome c family protein
MRNKIIYFISFISIFIIQLQACNNEESINYQRYYVNGKGLYEKHCQNCHGGDGKGLGTLYPPLTDTAYLIKNKAKLACVIKNGLNKQVTVNKVTYDEPMPGNISLADIDVAQVIVYITNSFGSKQGFYDSAQVTEDLKNCN